MLPGGDLCSWRMLKKIKKQSGQTLIETVFVLAFAGLILSGLIFAIIYFARVSQVNRLRFTAIKTAEGKTETLRSLKKNDPDSFWTQAESGYAGSETGAEITDLGLSELRYTFEDYLLEPGPPPTRKVKIRIKVFWKDGSQTREFETSSYYTD